MKRDEVFSRKYAVIIHEAEEGGYWTSVPALPGAGSQGETRDEALAMTRESIALMLEALLEDGKPLPEDFVAEEAVAKVATPV